jgi:hypothetical protein
MKNVFMLLKATCISNTDEALLNVLKVFTKAIRDSHDHPECQGAKKAYGNSV